MTTNAGKEQEDKPFRAVLYPHRSLSPRGFLILMSVLGIVSFIAGMVFLAIGAWPVFGFFGLDVALIYIAFKLNYRSGRARELVEVTPNVLAVTRIEPSGKEQRFEFNTYWVRVLFDEEVDGRTSLRLTSHGKNFEFARFLNDEERREFAAVLSGALASARGRSQA
jgi:uncharacterized membrane protein